MQDKSMDTRKIIIKAILSGKKTTYSISSKFAYILKGVDTKAYVDTFAPEKKYEKIMNDITKIDDEVMVSFHGNGDPSDLKFYAELGGRERAEFYVPVDDGGAILYWKVRRT